MRVKLSWRGSDYTIDHSAGVSLAIPLDPHGDQPSFFVENPASAIPLESGDYIGNVSAGGSCNAEVIRFVPHCHGTHTECLGHITPQRITVQQTIFQQPCVAQLLTLQKEAETADDEISLEHIESLINPDVQALIIRTLPNKPSKMSRNYSEDPVYPVFSAAAMEFLSSSLLQHLLLDTPSLDRANDGGKLTNHRIWWGVSETDRKAPIEAAKRSVTELVYVPDSINDDLYWLHLELSPLMSDATPSRPVIYPLIKE